MATITATGSGSGIDIESLVKELSAAERKAVDNRLTLRETQVTAEVTAYNSLKGALTDLQKSFSGLTTVREVSKRTGTSSAPTVFTVSAGSSAIPGSTQIQVDRLAQAHKIVSAGYATPESVVGTGTLTLAMGGQSFSVNIKDAENDSLVKVRDAINSSADNPGIKASILTVSDPDNPGKTLSKLVFTAEETGAANAITVTATDSDGNDTDAAGLSALVFNPGVASNMQEISAAQDARIFVDGFEATSSSNVFSGVIEGVSITAVSADPANAHTMTIGVDSASVQEKVGAFVAAYNAYQETFAYLTRYDANSKEAGLLTGDSAARSAASMLNRALTAYNNDDTGDFPALANIGITRNREGVMELDADMLTEALGKDFDSVANLLAGENGIFKKLDDAVKSLTNSADGMLTQRNNTLEGQLDDIEEQREAFELRMTSFTERIRSQFTNMDILVAQLKSTGDYISQQFEAISASKK